MGEIDFEIAEIQTESAARLAHKRFIAIVEEAGGTFSVVQHNGPGGVAPTSSYPSAKLAAARVLQLLSLGPVAPQAHPEKVCVGTFYAPDQSEEG